MSPHGKFTVAIVYVSLGYSAYFFGLPVGFNSGGGIGGLAFAVALAKTGADVDVDIYESAAKFSEIGAGIGMWPRVWNTLVGLGLEDDLKRRGTNVGQGETRWTTFCDILNLATLNRRQGTVLQGRSS